MINQLWYWDGNDSILDPWFFSKLTYTNITILSFRKGIRCNVILDSMPVCKILEIPFISPFLPKRVSLLLSFTVEHFSKNNTNLKPCTLLLFHFTANEILNVLNTGTVKNLKSLQSIGEKRAQLIHNWRQMVGQFEKVTALLLYIY